MMMMKGLCSILVLAVLLTSTSAQFFEDLYGDSATYAVEKESETVHSTLQNAFDQSEYVNHYMKELPAFATCPEMSCSKLGQSCDGDANTPNCTNPVESGANCCAVGLWCVEGECVSNALGQSCNVDGDCRVAPNVPLPSHLQCLNKVCSYVKFPNDACEHNNECTGKTTCSSEGVCVGLTEGSSCEVIDVECAYGLYCRAAQGAATGACTKVATTGEDCETHNLYQCGFFDTCLDGKCVDLFSQQEGEQCTPDSVTSDVSACAPGLYCESHGVIGNNRTCEQPDSTKVTECDTNEDCENGGACVCSIFSGDSFCDSQGRPDLACGDEEQALTQCMKDNECFPESDWVDGTCIGDKCSKQIDKLSSCNCKAFDDIFDDCIYLNTAQCAKKSSKKNNYIWAYVLVAIGAVIILGLIIVVGVVLYKKKKPDYESLE